MLSLSTNFLVSLGGSLRQFKYSKEQSDRTEAFPAWQKKQLNLQAEWGGRGGRQVSKQNLKRDWRIK